MEQEIIYKEHESAVVAAIQSLNPLSNQIIELFLEKQMTRKEISILLNLRYDTIRKRIKKALFELQEELNRRGIYD